MRIYFFFVFLLIAINVFSQQEEQWSYHFQLTCVSQTHPEFNTPYTGKNSFLKREKPTLSLTSTLFLGTKIWKGGSIYFNPELSGGTGLSNVQGIAGFPNGEIYRVSGPEPIVTIARLFYRQNIALGETKYLKTESDNNQLIELVPKSRITLTLGKFSVPDMFDNNTYSHDARTQFLNWSLMSNAAWDFPADVRGYTFGFATELIKPEFSLRLCGVAVPKIANGSDFDWNLDKAHSFALEFEKPYKICNKIGILRLISYYTKSHAGVYRDAINNKVSGIDTTMNVNSSDRYVGYKFGFGINIEQKLSDNVGLFTRAGWNDGSSATWAFTEIDHSFSLGSLISGKLWNREFDNFGIAIVANGISKDHRDFLNYGGYGFIIGDGQLSNYGLETVEEIFYSSKILPYFSLTADYQFVANPAFNKDRGPISIFSVRGHIEY